MQITQHRRGCFFIKNKTLMIIPDEPLFKKYPSANVAPEDG